MSGQQIAISVYRSLLQAGNQGWLEGTMQGVTSEQGQWQAPGRSAPISAQYAHAIAAQDFLVLGTVGWSRTTGHDIVRRARPVSANPIRRGQVGGMVEAGAG
jgi:hypothetical protein